MRVMGINPGPVATDRLQTMMRGGRAKNQFGDESRWQEFLSTMSFGRAATPEEIASAVAFLASPRSAYTSGTILTITAPPADLSPSFWRGVPCCFCVKRPDAQSKNLFYNVASLLPAGERPQPPHNSLHQQAGGDRNRLTNHATVIRW